MEREIKFRGKTKDGRWLKGNLLQFADKAAIVSSDDVAKTPLDYVGAAIVKSIVAAETVGQYTGRRDKDGEEIYEGDVLLDENDNPCVVVHKDDGWMLDYMGEFVWAMRDAIMCLCHVAGNKWDNPELIE